MDNITTRVDQLENTQLATIHTMDIRFSAVDARLAAVENRLTSIERLLTSLHESNQLIAQLINERLPPTSKGE